MAPWLAGRTETLVVNYHNITPPELLAAWDNQLALGQLRAQAELRMLASRTALAIADSAYNSEHLVAAGFADTVVVPPSAALGQRRPRRGGAGRIGKVAGAAVDGSVSGGWRRTRPFTRRSSPLMVTRAHRDPDATLLIVGKPAIAPYDDALHRYVAEMGLDDAVTFAGHASDATVAAAYAQADVLVVTSQHEGFCVPVTEAMSVGLPVVAYAQGALPEVLGPAGVLVDAVDPYGLASTIADLLGDPDRRRELAAAGRKQLAALDLEGAGDRLVDLVCALR